MKNSASYFLVNLARVEYAQEWHCVSGVELIEKDFSVVSLRDGQRLFIENQSDALTIYNIISRNVSLLINPPVQKQPDITLSKKQTWPNLLDDLGSYFNIFAEESKGILIKLRSIENQKDRAILKLQRGEDIYQFSYMYGGYPSALPLSLVQLILNPGELPFEPELNRI